eukprot:4397603-Amphidinium_carterae.1
MSSSWPPEAPLMILCACEDGALLWTKVFALPATSSAAVGWPSSTKRADNPITLYPRESVSYTHLRAHETEADP